MADEKKAASGVKVNIVDKPVPKGTTEVSLSSFAYLFSELVQYWQARVDLTQELERRLSEAGYGIGVRMLELLSHREKQNRKEKKLILMLQFIHTTVWKSLFGKVSDGLEKSKNHNDEYYIFDNDPITNKYISVPKDLGQFNCAAFIAGIINGVLDAAEFPAEVTAHFTDHQGKDRTVFIVKFSPEVVAREAAIQ